MKKHFVLVSCLLLASACFAQFRVNSADGLSYRLEELPLLDRSSYYWLLENQETRLLLTPLVHVSYPGLVDSASASGLKAFNLIALRMQAEQTILGDRHFKPYRWSVGALTESALYFPVERWADAWLQQAQAYSAFHWHDGSAFLHKLLRAELRYRHFFSGTVPQPVQAADLVLGLAGSWSWWRWLSLSSELNLSWLGTLPPAPVPAPWQVPRPYAIRARYRSRPLWHGPGYALGGRAELSAYYANHDYFDNLVQLGLYTDVITNGRDPSATNHAYAGLHAGVFARYKAIQLRQGTSFEKFTGYLELEAAVGSELLADRTTTVDWYVGLRFTTMFPLVPLGLLLESLF